MRGLVCQLLRMMERMAAHRPSGSCPMPQGCRASQTCVSTVASYTNFEIPLACPADRSASALHPTSFSTSALASRWDRRAIGLASLRDAKQRSDAGVRWYRCAQPPANSSNPFGVKTNNDMIRIANSRHALYPEGIKAISRWLSVATPPV